MSLLPVLCCAEYDPYAYPYVHETGKAGSDKGSVGDKGVDRISVHVGVGVSVVLSNQGKDR